MDAVERERNAFVAMSILGLRLDFMNGDVVYLDNKMKKVLWEDDLCEVMVVVCCGDVIVMDVLIAAKRVKVLFLFGFEVVW